MSFLVQVLLWDMLWSSFSTQSLSWPLPGVISNSLLVTYHNPIKKWFTVVAQNKRRPHFKMRIFFIFSQLMRNPLIRLGHLSNLFQCWMTVEWSTLSYSATNFPSSCKRISFDDCSQLVVANFWWPAIIFLIFKALVSFAKLVEPPLHLHSWVKWVVEVMNCLCCFMSHFALE